MIRPTYLRKYFLVLSALSIICAFVVLYFDPCATIKPKSDFAKTMSLQNLDDPRLADLLARRHVDHPLAKIALIGYPCDDGVARNNGRIGAKKGPASFRKYFNRLGTAVNPEYGVDLGKLEIKDLGDAVVAATLEETHENLRKKVEEALRENYIPVIVGGGNDQSYPNARAFMNNFGGNVGVVNIDAHLDVRPLKGSPPTLAHSGSPFRQLLEDNDFRRKGGVFVEFAAQGHQCSKAHADYVHSKGGLVKWLSEIRSRNNAVYHFDETMINSFGKDRPIFVSFDIDSIKSADCPGVSCPGSVGLTAEEALGICRSAGRNSQVKVIDFSEYNPDVEEDRTGRLLVNMVYHFAMGVVERF